MQALSKSEGQYNRSLGYSVEGGVAARRGKILVKTVVTDCAITPKRCNLGARMTLTKGIPHFEFGDLTSLMKSMSVPTDLETGLDEATRIVLGLVPCENGCHDGSRYRDGKQGMFKHLVTCGSWEPDVAREHVTALWKALN
jgi:hypothetical protein